jgi:ribosomal protein S18 acetylase RimI-like enzyme
MTVLRKLTRIPEVYAESGMRGIARAVSGRVFEHVEFVASQRDLRHAAPPAPCDLAFQLRLVDDALLEHFRMMPEPFPRHFEYRAIYGMRRCYAAWVGEDIGALMWPVFQADNPRMVNRWRCLLPDEARLCNNWASPAYRGTGLIDAAFEQLVSFIGHAGFRYLYNFTWIGNHSARKLYTRRGLREVASVHRYSFRWQPEGSGLYFRSPIPRDELASEHPGGDMDLPEVIPQQAASR